MSRAASITAEFFLRASIANRWARVALRFTRQRPLGAAGAIEAVASVLSLKGGFIAPTVNLITPDPAFGLDYVPGRARNLSINVIVSNSFAFGGNNTALVLMHA